MKRRLLLGAVLASAGIAIPLTVIPSSANADPTRPSGFEHLDGAFNYSKFKPAALDPARQLKVLIQVTGTQTGDLALPMHGMPPFPATGLAVDLPQVQTRFVLKDNKVSEMNIKSVPGGGLAGLLQQIGTELPVAQRLDEEFQPGF